MATKPNKTKPTIGIIILHFGAWAVTKDCLDSLEKLNTKYQNHRSIVVDNSQNSDIQQLIRAHSTEPYLIAPEKNLGFAAGNNIAIKYCQKQKYDYILLLNNDTIVTPDFLDKLIKNKPVKAAIQGPVIKHKIKLLTLFDYGGYINQVKGQPRHINLNQARRPIDADKHPKEQLTKVLTNLDKPLISRDFVTGCCMLIPTQIIKNIGFLTESYFMYLEDVEYCLRAKQNHIPTYLNTTSEIFHKGSSSSTEWLKIRYSFTNSIKNILKYTPPQYRLSAIAYNLYFYPSLLALWKLKQLKRWLRGQ